MLVISGSIIGVGPNVCTICEICLFRSLGVSYVFTKKVTMFISILSVNRAFILNAVLSLGLDGAVCQINEILLFI